MGAAGMGDDTPARASSSTRGWWLAAAVIVGSVPAAFWPTLDNELLAFDDRRYVYENPLVVGDQGFLAIWTDLFEAEPKNHYYPLTFTSFRLEHAISPIPGPVTERSLGRPAYPLARVDQMLLHTLNALGVLLVLGRLGAGLRVAATVACLFAVHPVTVASVAWLAERKNLLAGVLFWLTLFTYVGVRRRPGGRPARLALAVPLSTFALGLLAKSAIVVLAPLLVVTDRVLDGRWSRSSLLRTSPFFALALAAGLLTVAREAALEQGTPGHTELYMRPFLAVAAVAHYVGKTVLPIEQAIIYPRWPQTLAAPRYALSALSVGVATAWAVRRRAALPPLFLWGVACFLLTVAPTLGLTYFIWNQFAFASDHYLYFGLPGVLLALVALADRALAGRRADRAWLAVAVAVGVLFTLRSAAQSDTWQSNRTLWQHTLEVSPDAFIAHQSLANLHLFENQDCEAALPHLERVAELSPTDAAAWISLGGCLAKLGRSAEAVAPYQTAARLSEQADPSSWSAHMGLANLYLKLGRLAEARRTFEQILAKAPPIAEEVRAAISWIDQQMARRAGAADASAPGR